MKDKKALCLKDDQTTQSQNADYTRNKGTLMKMISQMAAKFEISQKKNFSDEAEFDTALENLKNLQYKIKDLEIFYNDLKQNDRKGFEKIKFDWNNYKKDQKNIEKIKLDLEIRRGKEEQKKRQEQKLKQKPGRKAMQKVLLNDKNDDDDRNKEEVIDERQKYLEP